jgi:hypothetical protein
MAWLVTAGAAALTALAALCVAYRAALVRGLRERHPALWEELGRPTPLGVPGPTGRRLGAFLRAERYYTLNDADLAAAARLYVVTRRALTAAVALGAVGWLLLR